MGTQIKGAKNIQADFAVETEPLETNGRDFIARFVEGVNLQNTRSVFPRLGAGLRDGLGTKR